MVLHFSRVHHLFCLLLLMIIIGCEAETAVPTPALVTQPTPTMMPTPASTPTCSPRTESPLRFLALGDSYTIGESVAASDRWPMQLVDALREQGVDIAEPEIIAKTGWTTAQLAAGIAAAQPAGPFDLVSLLIGVNNQYRGLSQAKYQEEFVGLLETAVSLANNDPNRVFVISIPDWGATPFAHRQNREEIGAAIDAFNAINRAETAHRGIVYIDITEISRRARTNSALTAEDFLHPSGEMYRLWVEQMQPELCLLLAQEIGA